MPFLSLRKEHFIFAATFFLFAQLMCIIMPYHANANAKGESLSFGLKIFVGSASPEPKGVSLSYFDTKNNEVKPPCKTIQPNRWEQVIDDNSIGGTSNGVFAGGMFIDLFLKDPSCKDTNRDNHRLVSLPVGLFNVKGTCYYNFTQGQLTGCLNPPRQFPPS